MMYKEDPKVICIILDKRYDIQYTNIDNQKTLQYIEKLNALQRLSESLPIEYDLEDYHVIINRIHIGENTYYIVTAILECSKYMDFEKSFIDAVTGLYNRNYWEQICSGETFLIKIQHFALIIIDIDNLKEINDSYGHMAGDKGIKIVGKGIRECIRKEDIGIRYGGDEFIILLLHQDKNTANGVIERIRREIKKSSIKHELNIQISTGVACGHCLQDLKKILQRADKDLYKEKEIKKRKKKPDSTVHDLTKEILEIRDAFNTIVTEKNKMIPSTEIVKLSEKLDSFIVKYLKKKGQA